MAEDPEDESADNEEEEPAADAEREVPIGVPVSDEEFARLKEQAAKPASGDERPRPDEDASKGDKEEGNG